jgi:hypothetical protein
MPTSTCLRWVAAIAFAIVGWSATASAEVTGHWYSPGGTIRNLVQSGDDVTMTSDDFTYEGTFAGSTFELTSVLQPWDSYVLTLSPDEATLSGTRYTITCFLSYCVSAQYAVSMSPCACYDGNAVNGDGCDIECRIEEEGCQLCSGDPASCTSAADGAPCDSRSTCITGGSCQAGVCEGGVARKDCYDFNAGWLRTEYSFAQDTVHTAVWEGVQENGEVHFYRRPSTVAGQSALVDHAMRAIQIDEASTGSPWCTGNYYPEANPIAEDGRSFTAWGQYVSQGGPGRCASFEHFGELGLRCADIGLEAGDGCRVDSCQRCGGVPEICEPVPDGTPCVPDDPSAVVSTCNNGECLASISNPTSVNGCDYTPRDNCRSPIDPSDTKLSLKDAEGGDRLKWSWKDGGRIASYDLGRTDLYSEVALCIFDESVTGPPLFAGIVNEGLDPLEYNGRGSELGWSSKSDGSIRYKERTGRAHGITQIRIETGAAGHNSIVVKGAGLSLHVPRAELPVPLRVQLQIQGGACFEGRFGAEGVSKNADGSFRAKGTP